MSIPEQVPRMLKLLFIGDIVGRPGREIVAEKLPRLRTELSIDFVIANAENAAAGAGGGVFRVGDHEIDAELRAQTRQLLRDDFAAGPANNIADKEQLQHAGN